MTEQTEQTVPDDGLYLIIGGWPRLVNPSMLAGWLALGRGGPLRGDLLTGEHILRGLDETISHVDRLAVEAARRRPPVLGDGS